jgi:hypothetical protein
VSRPEDSPSEDSQTSRFDGWFRPFFEDSALWPVTAAVLISLSVFGAMVLLLALRERSLYAAVVLAVLAGASLDALWRALRQGVLLPVAGALAGLWLGSGALAWVALHFGLF